MQLFVLDYDPRAAAEMLCDVHLRKMCLENAQILSGVLSGQQIALHPAMPRCFNINHPVIRAVNSVCKINWVVRYNIALHAEYYFRFGKKHLYAELTGEYEKMLFVAGTACSAADYTFCRNFKTVHISTSDIVQAYRSYYCWKKTQLALWHYTRRHEPEWLLDRSGFTKSASEP